MVRNSSQSGYSMVEVLVAIGILLMATAGPMTIAARSLQNAQYAVQQNVAVFMAQEGIEAIYKVRDDAALAHIDTFPSGSDSWDWVTDAALDDCFIDDGQGGDVGCGIDWYDDNPLSDVQNCASGNACRLYDSGGSAPVRYTHISAGNEATMFTRVITLETVTGGDVQARSTVTWQPTNWATPRSVSLQVFLGDIYDLN